MNKHSPASPNAGIAQSIRSLYRSVVPSRKPKAATDTANPQPRRKSARPEVEKDDVFFWLAETSRLNSKRTLQTLQAAGLSSFDLVIAHELRMSGYAGLRAASQFGARVRLLDNVEFPHLSGRSRQKLASVVQADPAGDELFSSWLTEIANRYEHIFTTSEGQRTTLAEMGVRAPISLLRNARRSSQEARSDEIRKACNCRPGDILLRYCNNVYRSSGAEDIVKALEELPANYRLCFLGKVLDIENELKKLVAELGVQDRVFFLDPVPPDMLIRYSSGADLALIPLRPEVPNNRHCLPNRVFESIAARNPIIAPSMIETGQFVDEHGIGVTFNEFFPHVIARAIRKAVDLKAEGHFDKPLDEAAERFSWEREQKTLLDAVGEGHGRPALILACKVIERNDRIYRMTQSLVDRGYHPTVVGYSEPMPGLKRHGVRYVVLPRE